MSRTYTDRWKASWRVVGVLYLCLFIRQPGLVSTVGPLRCVRAEEADILIEISNLHLRMEIKKCKTGTLSGGMETMSTTV